MMQRCVQEAPTSIDISTKKLLIDIKRDYFLAECRPIHSEVSADTPCYNAIKCFGVRLVVEGNLAIKLLCFSLLVAFYTTSKILPEFANYIVVDKCQQYYLS
jgi:hypothetical protein